MEMKLRSLWFKIFTFLICIYRMDAYRLFPGMVSQSALMQTQHAAKNAMVSMLNSMQFSGVVEGFATSMRGVLTATDRAPVKGTGVNANLDIFDTGRGVSSETTAIPSQVEALQSFLDLYKLYTTVQLIIMN